MLTAIVLAKNEAKNLKSCLDSLRFCDQVIVIDDNSTDDTSKIAKNHCAKVIPHTLNADFSAARNFGLAQVKSGWVLFIDADEIVSPNLSLEIQSAIQNPAYQGYYIRRFDTMWGKQLEHGDAGTVWLLRLAKVGVGTWHGRVHETWAVSPATARLTQPLLHYPHPSLNKFLQEVNFYSTIKAQEFNSQGRKTNLAEITFGPIWRFIKSYILKLGFLDGTPGFIHAAVMAFYMYLVAGKLYLLSKGVPPKHG